MFFQQELVHSLDQNHLRSSLLSSEYLQIRDDYLLKGWSIHALTEGDFLPFFVVFVNQHRYSCNSKIMLGVSLCILVKLSAQHFLHKNLFVINAAT